MTEMNAVLKSEDVNVVLDTDSREEDRILFFHVSHLVSSKLVDDPKKAFELETRSDMLLMGILKIRGVQKASLDRYKIRVERSLAIDGGKIIKAVEALVRETVLAARGDLDWNNPIED